ncbi:mucin-17-like [Schistocerca gregaria]|uniref:mucin-17-like n=1 Tax=Schistocerca gregaria TaxID=7010 RepID=UPI00211E6784|nr:mucin-17-like [Schistocerca gregaria]
MFSNRPKIHAVPPSTRVLMVLDSRLRKPTCRCWRADVGAPVLVQFRVTVSNCKLVAAGRRAPTARRTDGTSYFAAFCRLVDSLWRSEVWLDRHVKPPLSQPARDLFHYRVVTPHPGSAGEPSTLVDVMILLTVCAAVTARPDVLDIKTSSKPCATKAKTSTVGVLEDKVAANRPNDPGVPVDPEVPPEEEPKVPDMADLKTTILLAVLVVAAAKPSVYDGVPSPTPCVRNAKTSGVADPGERPAAGRQNEPTTPSSPELPPAGKPTVSVQVPPLPANPETTTALPVPLTPATPKNVDTSSADKPTVVSPGSLPLVNLLPSNLPIFPSTYYHSSITTSSHFPFYHVPSSLPKGEDVCFTFGTNVLCFPFSAGFPSPYFPLSSVAMRPQQGFPATDPVTSLSTAGTSFGNVMNTAQGSLVTGRHPVYAFAPEYSSVNDLSKSSASGRERTMAEAAVSDDVAGVDQGSSTEPGPAPLPLGHPADGVPSPTTVFVSPDNGGSFGNVMNTAQEAVMVNRPSIYAFAPEYLSLNDVREAPASNTAGNTAKVGVDASTAAATDAAADAVESVSRESNSEARPVSLPLGQPADSLTSRIALRTAPFSLYPNTMDFGGVPIGARIEQDAATSSHSPNLIYFGGVPVILGAVLSLAVAIPVDAQIECETSDETSRAVSLEDKAADSAESKPAVPVNPQHSEPVNAGLPEMTGTKPSDESIQVTVPGNNPLTSLPLTSADIVSLCSKLSYNFPGSSPNPFYNSINTEQAAVLQNWLTSYAGVPQQLPLDEVYKVITFGKPGMTAAAMTEKPGVVEGGPTAVPATWSPETITFGGVPVRPGAQGPAGGLSFYPNAFSFAGVPVKIAFQAH